MNIPTREECLELFRKHNTPENVIRHCKRANKTAVFLAKKLKEKNIDLNIEAVDKASLLHDFARTKGMSHSKVGHDLLKNTYPLIAKIILVHNTQNISDLKTWEQKIVFYADKRSLDDQLVILTKRYADAKERYGALVDGGMFDAAHELEKQIFNIIGIEPDKLGEYLD